MVKRSSASGRCPANRSPYRPNCPADSIRTMNDKQTNTSDQPSGWSQYSKLLANLPSALPSADSASKFHSRLDARLDGAPGRYWLLRWYTAPALAILTMATVVCLGFLTARDTGTGLGSAPASVIDPAAGKSAKHRRQSSRRNDTPDPAYIPEIQIPAPPEFLHDSLHFIDPFSSQHPSHEQRYSIDPSPGPGWHRSGR